MTAQRKFTFGLLLAALALMAFAAIELFRGPRSFLAGFDRSLHTRYEEISNGLNKRRVVEALGEPRSRSDEFNLPQRQGFEPLFDAAKKSSAVEYYLWINGPNWYYCIGFDAAGTVVFKGEGHS